MSFKFTNTDKKIQQVPNYAPGKRHLSKIYWYILLAFILTPFVYLGYNIFVDAFFMSAKGHLMFGEIVIRAPHSSYVSKINLLTGQTFCKDDILIELNSPELNIELKALEENLNILKDKEQRLLSNKEEIQRQKEALLVAKGYILDCEKYLEELYQLKAKGLMTIMEIAKARDNLNNANQQYITIQGNIARLEQQKELDDEEYFDKNARDTQAKIENITNQISLLSIKAPEAGTVAKLIVNVDEYVKEGEELEKIIIKNNIHIVAYLESKYISAKLSQDQIVSIVFPDGTKIKGKLAANPVYAESDPSQSSLVQTDKNKLYIKVIAVDPIPSQYQVEGLPVTILF